MIAQQTPTVNRQLYTLRSSLLRQVPMVLCQPTVSRSNPSNALANLPLPLFSKFEDNTEAQLCTEWLSMSHFSSLVSNL